MSSLSRVIGMIIVTGMVTLSGNLQAKNWDEITYQQTLEIKKGRTDVYVTSSGEKFSVGQEIMYGSPAHDGRVYTYVMQPAYGIPAFPFPSLWNGRRTTIKKITWKQAQGVPEVLVNARSKGAKLGRKQMILNLEAAIETGEVVSSMQSKKPVAEKSPIERLKEAKELLDLEVITQDEYDEIKQTLTPLILGN